MPDEMTAAQPTLAAPPAAYAKPRHVRPWALSAPIVVLLLALPLLRPLRHPLEVSPQESAYLAAARASVDHPRDDSPAVWAAPNQRMPVFSYLLAGPYWVLRRLGWRMDQNAALVSYLLTLIAVTIPVAASAGLIYRMGRVFELPRPWRAGLALAVVAGSGLLSYSTVLNPHAPAAAAILTAAACLIHVGVAGRPGKSAAPLMVAGFMAALAAVLDISAAIVAMFLPLAIVAMAWKPRYRVAGLLLFAFGALPLLSLHLALTHPPAFEPAAASAKIIPAPLEPGETEDLPIPSSMWETIGTGIGDFLEALLGAHGLLSHFPVMLVAVVGVMAVLRRHWPPATKILALASLASAAVIIAGSVALGAGAARAMFASPFFIAFSPLVLFWMGAWLRRSHHVAAWSLVGTLAGFSMVVGLIGATDPAPPGGYDRYTPLAALDHLIHAGGAVSAERVAKGY